MGRQRSTYEAVYDCQSTAFVYQRKAFRLTFGANQLSLAYSEKRVEPSFRSGTVKINRPISK